MNTEEVQQQPVAEQQSDVNLDEFNKQIDYMVAIMGNAYIMKNGLETVEQSCAKDGTPYDKKQLYAAHIMACKEMIDEEMALMDLDLQTEVEKRGQVFEEAAFSEYEKAIIINKVLNASCIIQAYKDMSE